jgi:hypothetical protein
VRASRVASGGGSPEVARSLGVVALVGLVALAAACDAGRPDEPPPADAVPTVAVGPGPGPGHGGPGGRSDTCGGFVGVGCGPGRYCAFEILQVCGRTDDLGVCKPIPRTCPEVDAPVCGCDGRSYINSCFANAVGVNVERPGD